MRLFLIPLLVIAAAAQQDLKTCFQNLAKTPIAQGPEAFEEAAKVAYQIESMPKAQLVELLPYIFTAAMDKDDRYRHAGLALYAAARRTDSGEIMRPYMNEIGAMFNHPDPPAKPPEGSS